MSRTSRTDQASHPALNDERGPLGALADTAQRRIWLLETLHHVNAHIAQSDDIETSLHAITDEISRRFQFTTVAIGVIDDADIVFRGRTVETESKTFRLPISSGVSGRVARNAIGELVTDVALDPDFVALGGLVSREAAVPIFVNGHVYGVLNVEAAEDISLGVEELDVLQSVAMSLGVAIERSRQRTGERRRLRHLSALQHITGRFAGRERVDENVADILHEIAQAFDFDFVSLGFIEGDQIHFHASFDVYTASGYPVGTFPVSSGITGRVARTGEPAFVTDVTRDPDFVGVRSETTQEICVPIYAGGDVAGVLNVELSDRRRVDQGDFDIVKSVGDHLGLAIANQRRIAELEQLNEQWRTVERVTQVIAGKLLIREALADILIELERGFGFGTTGIGLIEGDRLVFHAVRQTLDPTSIVAEYVTTGIPMSVGVTGRVATTGMPALIRDVAKDPDFLPTSPGIRHEACVPIRVGPRTVGVLNVETTAVRPLNEHDIEILSVIADHIGVAIQKSDLYVAEQESRRAIEAIQRVSTIVASTLDVEEALQLIVRTLSEAFSYPHVSLRLLEDDHLVLAAHSGGVTLDMVRSIPVGIGVVGRVARTGRAELIADVDAEPSYLRSSPGITSEVCVPILCDGDLAGVLNIEGDRDRPVTTQDLELMKTFAQHAGTVLQNARMYARMQHLATRDPITGMANHREFQIRLREEIARATRSSRALSLLLIDLDSFKLVNDSHGHVVGDHLLRAVAQRLETGLREGDVLARYGGDEFVVILADADREAAEHTAIRLSTLMAAEPFPVGDGRHEYVTVSIGSASFPTHGASAEALIRHADDSMYGTKRRGVARPR
ncbi:MAG TPA: GAF domain-containing protein [Thermomicrobiales bacterium]|nr:GAF domain-containing protein [Thermomicrobiales bacterium]